MLWIFDEESRRGASLLLLWDGLRSIFVQNLRPRVQRAEAVGPYYQEVDSSLPAERFAQVILITLFCSLSTSLFASMVVPRMARPISGLLYTHVRLLSSIHAPQQESPNSKLPLPN